MATREINGASIEARTRPAGITLALVLAVISVSLALSLIASRSIITQLHREAARLQTTAGTLRATVSALTLQIMAAHGVSEGPFERVRDHVVAKTAGLATHRSVPDTSKLPSLPPASRVHAVLNR